MGVALSIVKVIDLVALVLPVVFTLVLLVVFTGVYLWPSISPFKFTTDLAVVAPWLSLVGSLIAIAFTFLVMCCSGDSTECGIVLAIVAVINIVAYCLWAFKGNPGTICDGASKLADQAGAASMVNCSASWIKYAIYGLLVVSGLLQLAVAAMSFSCFGGGAAASAASSLGKRAAAAPAATMKSLGKRVRGRKDPHKWESLAEADEENDLVGMAEYPTRATRSRSQQAGLSETSMSDSSEGEGGEWREKKGGRR